MKFVMGGSWSVTQNKVTYSHEYIGKSVDNSKK